MTAHTREIPPAVVEARGRLKAIAELSHLPGHLWPDPPHRDAKPRSPETIARGFAHLRLCAMSYIEELSQLVHAGHLSLESGTTRLPPFVGFREYRTMGTWDQREQNGRGMSHLEHLHERFDDLSITLHGGLVHRITHAGLSLRIQYSETDERYEE